MAMHDPVLHRFISYLAEKKSEQEEKPDAQVNIELSRSMINDVRGAFRHNILQGERHLHSLSHILSSTLFGVDFELHSNVIGALPDDEDRPFLIRERLNKDKLFSVMDIDLGNQMLDNFRYNKAGEWVKLQLSANFVEYIPVSDPGNGVNRLTSRVKAEEEIWNKVTDEIFQIDRIVSRDKKLAQYSKYVKDIFGIKVICENEEMCLKVHDRLEGLKLRDPALEGFVETEQHLQLIETKNYLTCSQSEMKKTGWKAMKSVARWQGRLFELQVQPLGNYYLELDHMSGPSHQSFKSNRDILRDEIAKAIPLYGFYLDLLQMIFRHHDYGSFVTKFAGVTIKEDMEVTA